MRTVEFYEVLGRSLPEHLRSQVVLGLCSDPLVWSHLQDEAFLRKVQAHSDGDVSLWSLAHLAQVELESQPGSAEFPASLRDEAVAHYQSAIAGGEIPQTFRQAALLAAALVYLEQEEKPIGEIIVQAAQHHETGTPNPIWKTVFACLYGLVKDNDALIQALINHASPASSLDWLVHMLLCNPLSDAERVTILHAVLSHAPLHVQIDILGKLELRRRNRLAFNLAGKLLESNEAWVKSIQQPIKVNRNDMEMAIQRALELQQSSLIFRYAGRNEESVNLLKKVSQVIGQWHSSVSVLNRAAELQSKADAANSNSTGKLFWLKNDGTALDDQTLSNLEQLDDEQIRPLVMLTKAEQAAQKGDAMQARKLAMDAAQALIQDRPVAGDPTAVSLAAGMRPHRIVRFLRELGLSKEAVAVARKSMQQSPADIQLLKVASVLLADSGDHEEALEAAERVIALEPDSLTNKRFLADLWGRMGYWEQALDQRQAILTLVEKPCEEDQLATAQCALKCGKPEVAAEISKRLLQVNPDHGLAHSFLGKALSEMGDLNSAGNHLIQATLLSPEHSLPWLALAEVQRKKGENQRALETLLAAALAVPDSAEINIALAETYLTQGLISEALPHLRRASHLSRHEVDVDLKLVKSLEKVGRLEEARDVARDARQKWPQNAELAFTLGELMAKLGDPESALEPMRDALTMDPKRAVWFEAYARTLLGGAASYVFSQPGDVPAGRVSEARRMLENALMLDSNAFGANVLAAEVNLLAGANADAFTLYQKVVDLPEANQADWRWRIKAGLGQAALLLGKLDTALAALQDAAQSCPTSLKLQQLLTEAYWKASLVQNAAICAEATLQMAPTNIQNLTWYTRMMVEMGQIDQAIDASETAVAVEPQSSRLRYELAELYYRKDDMAAARKNLAELMGTPGADEDDLHRSALLLARMHEYPQAIKALDLALAAGAEDESRLQLEKACLYYCDGDYAHAAESLQACQRLEAQAGLKRLLADIWIEMGAVEEAAAELEKSGEDACAEPLPESLATDLLPERWKKILEEPAAGIILKAMLAEKRHDYRQALEYARQALTEAAERAELRYFAVRQALIQMQSEQALEWLPADLFESAAELTPLQVELLAIRAHLLMDAARAEGVEGLIERGLKTSGESTALWAAKARLLWREGQLEEALKSLVEAQDAAEKQSLDHKAFSDGLPPVNPIADQDFWLVTALLEAGRFDAALTYARRYVEALPEETISNFAYVRALVQAAEYRVLCTELRVEKHLPNLTVEEARADFDRAILLAGQAGKTEAVLRWAARGGAIFHTSPQTVRTLALQHQTREDMSALVAALRRMSNPTAALQVSQRFLDSAEVLVQRALCMLPNEPEEGLASARRAVHIDPTQPVYHATVALLAERCDQYSEAEEALETALSVWPDEPEWHTWAAKMAEKHGDLQKAAKEWEQTLQLRSGRLDDLLETGRIYILLNTAERAIEVLEQAVRLAPERDDVWVRMADAYLKAGKVPEALQAAQKAGNLNPDSVRPLLLSGEISLMLGKIEAAHEYARAAYAKNPADSGAALFLAKVLEKRNQSNEALSILERAVSGSVPDLALMLEWVRMVRKVQGDSTALPLLQEMAKTHPQDARVLGALAEVQASSGDPAGAEMTAHQALLINPDQPALLILLGKVNRSRGQLDQAAHYLSEAVRLAPDCVDAYLELGQAYQERREYSRAMWVLQQATKLAQRDPRPYYQAAMVLREGKDYLGAESMLRRAAELAPDDLNIRRQLGAVVALNLIHHSQEESTYL